MSDEPPLWRQVIAMFKRFGAPEPPSRLRDEIVALLSAREQDRKEIERLRVRNAELEDLLARETVAALDAIAERDELRAGGEI